MGLNKVLSALKWGWISSGRVYVHVVNSKGGLCPRCKIHRGDYVPVTKFMGGLCPPIQK